MTVDKKWAAKAALLELAGVGEKIPGAGRSQGRRDLGCSGGKTGSS